MVNQFDSVWPEKRIERLRELWDEGHSAAEIGRIMGATKNAIVGKAHRIDLPSRPSPIHPLEPGQSYKMQKPRVRPLKVVPLPVLPSVAAAQSPPVRVFQIVVAPPPPVIVKLKPAPVIRPCTFPMWKTVKPTHLYCGKPQVIRSYCEKHARLCYARLPRDEAA